MDVEAHKFKVGDVVGDGEDILLIESLEVSHYRFRVIKVLKEHHVLRENSHSRLSKEPIERRYELCPLYNTKLGKKLLKEEYTI